MAIFLLTVQYLSIIMAAIEAVYVFSKWKNKTHGLLFINCLAIFINNLGYLLEMKSTTLESYIRALQFSYLGRVWIGLSLFLFILSVCKIKVKKWVPYVYIVFNIFIYTLVLTINKHTLYYKSYTFVEGNMFSTLIVKGGIFHTVYFASLIVFIIVGLTILFRAYFKEREETNKKRLFVLCLAMVIDCVFFIFQIIGLSDEYDITSFGYALSSFFMYYAIFRYSLLDTLTLARDYVIDELAESVIVLNSKGQVEYFNNPALKVFPELKDSPNFTLETIIEHMKENKPIQKNGRLYYFNSVPLVQKGIVTGEVISLHDDTDHINYMRELKEQKDIAEAANASKSRFISVVSHELRTPMNAVVGMTDLLLQDNLSLTAKQEQYLKNIKNSGSALVMIVNDILDQSKIEAGKMEIISSNYELLPLLDDIKMIIENRVGSKPIQIKMNVDNEVPRFLLGDSLRIRQIIINLMNNSVKFTDSGEVSLSITVEKEEEDKYYLRYSIKDTGQGIKEEDLKKLGEAFAQVDTQKNHSKEGTGLGLSISKDFISLMGGQLQISSEYGKGSEFFFSIYQGKVDETEQIETNEEVRFTAPKAKALVVDDTEINLMIAEEILAQLDINVKTASSGQEALDLVKKDNYDIIFMDYVMPGMDGVETTKGIRELSTSEEDEIKKEYFKTIPIIALSGDTSDETNKKFMDAGINDFTEKPIEIKKINTLLLKWLKKELIEKEEPTK